MTVGEALGRYQRKNPRGCENLMREGWIADFCALVSENEIEEVLEAIWECAKRRTE